METVPLTGLEDNEEDVLSDEKGSRAAKKSGTGKKRRKRRRRKRHVDEEEAYGIEEHAQVVLAILKPVAITMLLVIWAVRVIVTPTAKSFTQIAAVSQVYDVYQSAPSVAITPLAIVGALGNAVVFVVLIVVVTVVFVILYKYRCMKLIYGWLIMSSGLMLLAFGSIIFYFMISAYNLPIDIFTFGIFMWNFSVVGVVAVFFHGPQRVNQGYLIFISAFLAIFFTRLPEWTTWAILAAVAVYDLFAVLCPKGPLKVLVDLAQERQEPIPALLYNGSVFNLSITADAAEDSVDLEHLAKTGASGSVKLGLGDFVFYSVLVGRAAMFDWLTVFTCFVAIITGLFWTLLLLAVWKQALPALPLSIALAITFYILSRLFLLPFVLTLGELGIWV